MAKQKAVICKSYEFTELYCRRHDGYSITFFGYPTESSGRFNAGLEIAGPRNADLVKKILRAVAVAWPDGNLKVVVDEDQRIVDVIENS